MNQQAPTTDNALATVPSSELAKGETSTAAQAEQSRALVAAQYTVAMERPRQILDVENKLMAACSRARFADKARYAIPFKKKDKETGEWITEHVTGFSIRFAEEAIRLMGNILVQTPVVFDSDAKRIARVFVIDLESNAVYGADVTVEKVVERRYLKKGQKAIRARENNYGDTVFLIPATEQEFRAKYNSEISKMIRTQALRLLPADILEACEEQIFETLREQDSKDPVGAAKRIARAFFKLGVSAAAIEELLGHALDEASPAEIEKLRLYYSAVDEGHASFRDCVEVEQGVEPKKGEDDKHAALRSKVKAKLRSKKKATKKKDARKSDPKTIDAKGVTKPKDPRTPEQIKDGWEIDPNTNEAIPPSGGAG